MLRLGPPPGVIELPIEFSRAWIHLVNFWILLTTSKRSSRTLQTELSKCLRMLESGRTKIFGTRVSNPLHTYEAVLPPGIVSLVVNKLVGDVQSGSLDIEATYYAYVTKLVRGVPISFGSVVADFHIAGAGSATKTVQQRTPGENHGRPAGDQLCASRAARPRCMRQQTAVDLDKGATRRPTGVPTTT